MGKAVTKASRILNFIKRNFYMCSKSVKERLYLTLTRPHLEYGVAAWNPHRAGHVADLERVQRRAARFVQGDYNYSKNSSVTALISSLGWENLRDRRETHQMTQLFKIINQDIHIDATTHLRPKIQRTRRGNNRQFNIPQISYSVYQYSFFPRTIKIWNGLPFIDSPSYKIFRENYLTTLTMTAEIRFFLIFSFTLPVTS